MRLAVIVAIAALATPAWSATCDDVFVERGQIYKHEGYCFKTPRAVGQFGNAGCTVSDLNALSLTASERAAIGRLDEQDRALNCSW